jgi:hypothetical protein
MHIIIYMRLSKALSNNLNIPCTVFYSAYDPNVIALTKIFKEDHEFESWYEEMKINITKISYSDSLFKMSVVEPVLNMQKELEKFMKLSLIFNCGSFFSKNYDNSVLNKYFNFEKNDNGLYINKDLHEKPF